MNVQLTEKLTFLKSGVSNSVQSNSNLKLDDESTYEAEGKVKTRLLSMWNNMRNGFIVKMKTNFSKESPVWLLGRCYHCKSDSPSLSKSSSTELGIDVAVSAGSRGQIDQYDDEIEGIEAFKQDFVSRLWLTYRREFPLLNGSTYTSDCGWGCMLRSGQMMLAQALVCRFLGRGWRWKPDASITTERERIEDLCHRKIIRWFGDKPLHNSPLSLHTLVTIGEPLGKRPGDWYGPASVAHLLRQAVKLASKEIYEFDEISIYVSQDCTVYIQDVLDECLVRNGSPGIPLRWRSLVLLVPVRLGTEKLNPIYAPCLTTLLSLENCIGIIGGKPKHSLYFIGYQDDKLIHLDPHYCQEMVDVWVEDFSASSFHCTLPRKMNLSKMDPSCCLGFYCHTEKDFHNFIRNVQPFLIPPSPKCEGSSSNSGMEYPMFVFSDGRNSDVNKLKPARLYPRLPIEDSVVTYPSQDDEIHQEFEEFEVI